MVIPWRGLIESVRRPADTAVPAHPEFFTFQHASIFVISEGADAGQTIWAPSDVYLTWFATDVAVDWVRQ